MELYRLVRQKYGAVLSGQGAAQAGGRWNQVGTPVIYTSTSPALAMAEVLVHLSLDLLPTDFAMMRIEVPEGVSVEYLANAKLPKNWNQWPPLPGTQKLGQAFLEGGESCLLRVPSATVPGDFNYLINPRHADFALLRVTDWSSFPFDPRLFL